MGPRAYGRLVIGRVTGGGMGWNWRDAPVG